MSGFVSRFGTEPFRRVNRSMRIGGHATSIQLEVAFWEVLDAMATAGGMSTPKLIAAIHAETAELQTGGGSFASMLRTFCLLQQGAAAR